MDLIHHLHTGLGTAAGLVKLSLESISVLCVALGLVTALAMAFNNLLSHRPFHFPPAFRAVKFGTWLGIGPGVSASAPTSLPPPSTPLCSPWENWPCWRRFGPS